jgi:hypothetical protein
VSNEYVLGGLSVYVDQELVLAIDVRQTSDDGFQQIHCDTVTAFKPGDWTDLYVGVGRGTQSLPLL